VIIRLAAEPDYSALANLWFDSWDSVGISNETDLSREGVVNRFYTDVLRWTLFAAETEAGLAGLLALLPEEDRIDQIFVAPHLKGQGIGLALLNHAKQIMPSRIVLATQEANLRARAFYVREGFRLASMEDDPGHRRVKCHYVWTPGGGA
jgi:GNAT superfamily N-acetyltransferase